MPIGKSWENLGAEVLIHAPHPPATIAEANDRDVEATGCAAISEEKFNFQLCNSDKEHAKKLTFPQKQLVIAKYPVHLIE